MNGFNQQPFPPAPQPPASIINPPPEQPSPPNRSWLKWIVLIILISLLSSTATYLVLQSQRQPPSPAEVSTKAGPSPTPTLDETTNWKTYTNTALNYSLIYPPTWKLELQQPIEGIRPQESLVNIKSPDYTLTTEGIETLSDGVQISVHTDKTTEISIDTQFEKDRLAVQIASNKTTTIVDGAKAIQYDFSYENTQATHTIFIKNGVAYSINFVYADVKAKNANFPVYLNILKSFKAP